MNKIKFDGKKANIFSDSKSAKESYQGRCLSKSMLMSSGTHKQLENYLQNKFVITRQTVMGNVLHTLVLEPHLTKRRYSPFYFTKTTIEPGISRQFVHYSDYSEAILMSDSFVKNGYDQYLHSYKGLDSLKEHVFFYEVTFEEHKFGVKGVIDISIISEEQNRFEIYDLKTTSTLDPIEIEDKITKYGYDIQCYMYTKFFEIKYNSKPKFVLLFINKTVPYECLFYELNEEHYKKGEQKFVKCMTKIVDFINEKGYNSRFERVKQATAS